MARTPKTTSSAAASDDANSGNSSGEFEWSAPKQPQFPNDPYPLPHPGRYKDKPNSNPTMGQPRVFSVPLPEVSLKTKQAIRAYLVKHHPPPKSGMKDSERKLKELKLEEKQASQKAKVAKDKLAQALLTRSEKQKEIRKAHELVTQKQLEELEAKLQAEHEKENFELEEKITKECKLEYEKKFEEEIVHKRKRDQEEDEALEKAQAAKKAKEGEEEKGSGEDKETSADDKTRTKVQELEKKREDLKQEMEKLSEKKREFIWLLKQVIKQEAMQKMKLAKLKKAEAK